MKTCFTKSSFRMITIALVLFIIYPITIQAQTDIDENYFPTKVGTMWVYKIYPNSSSERERITITKDSLSAIDGSHYIFLNDDAKSEYRVDTMSNVYYDPLGNSKNSNQLIFKQNANKLEAWAASDSSKIVYRIKEIGFDFILNRWVKVKVVEWGSKTFPDTFGLSRRSDYYGNGFGWYFAIIEPSATERILVGFITGSDTLGDITKVIDFNKPQLSSFNLHQNYPNPFNPTTTINYQLQTNSKVSLKIYDILGREVVTLVNEVKSAGTYSTPFNSTRLASGVYFYRIEAASTDGSHIRFTDVKKMMYLK